MCATSARDWEWIRSVRICQRLQRFNTKCSSYSGTDQTNSLAYFTCIFHHHRLWCLRLPAQIKIHTIFQNALNDSSFIPPRSMGVWWHPSTGYAWLLRRRLVKFGPSDLWFMPNVGWIPDSFSYQVRSLANDVIIKPLQGKNCRSFALGYIYEKDVTFRK